MTRRLNLSAWHILVVDDDPPSVLLIKEIFSRHKATIYSAASGPEALHQIEKMPRPTVILCDIVMPHMNGYILLGELRKFPNVVNVPIIAVTAQAMLGNRESILEAGFDGYISKPYRVGNFIVEVITWMSTKKRLTLDELSEAFGDLSDIAEIDGYI